MSPSRWSPDLTSAGRHYEIQPTGLREPFAAVGDARSAKSPLSAGGDNLRLLVVEDSERLQKSLKHGLSREGYAVDVVGDGHTALQYARTGAYVIVVLDLMIPGRDGISVLKTIRGERFNVHVLIHSARDQIDDRIAGLDGGADDYLVKPLAFKERLARVNALGRRHYNAKSPILSIGDTDIDTSLKRLTVAGKPVLVSRKEFAVVEALFRCKAQVLSRTQLIEKTRDFDQQDVSENAMEVLVSSLRKKLRSARCAPPCKNSTRIRRFCL